VPKDRSCEATIYPFVGRARAAALGAPSASVFLGSTPKHERRGAGSGKSRSAAAQAAKVSRMRQFSRPGSESPSVRTAQLGETEVPNTAGQR